MKTTIGLPPRSALFLLLASGASAGRPLGLAPAQLSKDEEGDPGRCVVPGSCPDETHDPDPDAVASVEIAPIEATRDAVWSQLDRRQGGLLHRQIERAHVRKTFPDAEDYALRRAGNYTDGTRAGSPSWLGDVGAQDANDPTYVSLGSVLDLSSSPYAGAINVAWLASLVRRRELVDVTSRSDGREDKPCRTDLLDDYDHPEDEVCWLPVEADDYVSVRRSEGERSDCLEAAKAYGVARGGTFLTGDWKELDVDFFGGRTFDTILADGVLHATTEDDAVDPEMHDMDTIVEGLVGLLRPGGTIYLLGREPPTREYDGPGWAYHGIHDVFNAIKSLSGVFPKKDLSATWVHRTARRLGLNVHDSTLFPARYTFDEMHATIDDARSWAKELPDESKRLKRVLYEELLEAADGLDELARDGVEAVPGGYDYVVAAELPYPGRRPAPAVAEPAPREVKYSYDNDHDPEVEELDLRPLRRGEMMKFGWANGDDYDGTAGRIGVPPHLASTIRDYVKKLGIWDLMVDTVLNDPMSLNTTRFYTVETPFGDRKRNFTWSAKRPDNFYGSDSDMHWFDIADEAAHEDSLRALAEGGFDEVLNAIGTYLGLDHLVAFSIGLLAVTKADKGYVHIDFSNSRNRAFNFLINLHSPEEAGPELTIVEEDDLGNRRRGQVKYAPDFGVLNGDDAMHATNECDHRPYGGVRITASIFVAELERESLKQVAEHDKYYFPFGNMDWIWAQRGRHWNREGTASLVNDRGRARFEAEDDMENCEERVGEDMERCLLHGEERMLCYRTCGAFMDDDEFLPGEERREIFGW